MKSLRLYASLIVSTFLVASCGMKEDPAAKAAAEKMAMMEKNKTAAHMIDEMFMAGVTDSASNYISENIIEHQVVPGGATTGVQSFKDIVNFYHTAFPDAKIKELFIAADGDYVTVHVQLTGTNTGPMGAMPPTNKAVDFYGVDLYRFENGKAIEHWAYMGEMKFMAQLSPAPEAPKKK